MYLAPTDIPGCVVVRPERHADGRGHFARTWDGAVFAAAGLPTTVAQCSASFSERAGTLRGMHWQVAPHAEAKLVRCTRGAVFDVCLDLRPDSPTFRRWHGETLTADNGVSLLVPEGCAHGCLTLEDATEVLYMISAPFVPEAARGVRYDDPAFGIAWPREVTVIHPRDASYPLVGAEGGVRKLRG
ncbi:dTDP-4-dehydrorhamnose 3,5-epimerase family protein [Rubrivirga sp.]|uniref:dTDP-4-dehydrorhamnose 3,5-epimerase family protein n=1 Tax=Rubrivirga sp. TaxID=1885344 RepID=UPI003B515CA3